MAYKIEIARRAHKALAKLPKSQQGRIGRAIDRLSQTPRPPGVEKVGDLWQIRVGDYRIVYDIPDRKLIVLVLRVGHRRETYEIVERRRGGRR